MVTATRWTNNCLLRHRSELKIVHVENSTLHVHIQALNDRVIAAEITLAFVLESALDSTGRIIFGSRSRPKTVNDGHDVSLMSLWTLSESEACVLPLIHEEVPSMKISQIAAYLKKMSGEMEEFAARNDDMDLPEEVVLPFITNFITGNLIDLTDPSAMIKKKSSLSRGAR